MAIDNLYLYTASGHEEANRPIQKHLEASSLRFTHLHYQDPSQHRNVVAAVSTWFTVPVAFPFVVYHDVDKSVPPAQWTIRSVVGLDAILDTDFKSL